VAAARTCYSPRIVKAEDVRKDEKARSVRDRIARETYQAGHHTTLQHATFQFSLENVSRQLIWSVLHAHPFYNSEQVSQRYVEVKPERVIAKMSQETLAEMVGTTRSRVSTFMNKFRKLGFIDYNGEQQVHTSLLNVVLHDNPVLGKQE